MLERYYRYQLNQQEETRAYDDLCSAISYRYKNCYLYDLNIQQADRVLKAVTNDCPQFYDCMLIFHRLRQESDGVQVSLSYRDIDRKKMERAKRKAVDIIEKKVGRYGSDYLVAKCVYDYLAENVRGDNTPLNEYTRICSIENDEQHSRELQEYLREYGDHFTAYGALVEKKAVCMGMAMAYKLLMKEFKIETACVSGQVGGVNHMMNVVEMDRQFAFCDVTHGVKSDNLPMIRYDYFLVSGKRIGNYFEPDTLFPCNSEQLSYFYRNNLVFKDINSLRKYLNKFTYQSTGGMIRCLFEDMGEAEKDVSKLIYDVIFPRIESEYMITGYDMHNRVLNCLIEKKKQ